MLVCLGWRRVQALTGGLAYHESAAATHRNNESFVEREPPQNQITYSDARPSD